MRKRYFSLLEVLIAFSLASLIFMVLLGGYFQAQYAAALATREEVERFPEKYLLHRLSDVFLNLSPKVDQASQVFFTFDLGESKDNTPALLFSYDNGMVFNPLVSGDVLGLLFLDQEGNFTMITWAAREKWSNDKPPKMHREVLWPHVKNVRFDFFSIPENQSPQWVERIWPKELKASPAAIRISVETQEKSNDFYFPVPRQLAVIREKK